MRHDLQLEAARSELRNLEVQLEQAQREQSDRASRRAELKTDQDRLRQETNRLEELQGQEQESSASLDELRQASTDTEAAVEAALQSEASWRRILDRITRSAELNDLLRQQREVEAVQERLAEAQRQAEQIKVTDESLQHIRQATDMAEQANARLSVAATRISFDIPSDRLPGIEADGVPLTDPPMTVEAVEPVSITIPERGQILIEPAVADRDQLLRTEREARAELHAALSEVGAKTLADAQILRDQRRDLEVIAGGGPFRNWSGSRRPAARRHCSHGSTSCAKTWRPCKQKCVLRSCRRGITLRLLWILLRRNFGERETRNGSLAGLWMRGREPSQTSGWKCAPCRTPWMVRPSWLKGVMKGSEASPRLCPISNLLAVSDTAAQAVAEQQQAVSLLEGELSPGTRTQLEARISRLQTAIKQRESSRVDLRIEIVRLRERIEAHDSAGIDEAIEHTQHELEGATRRRDRFERDLEVLGLLADTLRAAESEARERYLAPVVSRVHPYLQMLFPNAEIGITEDLYITGMSRNAGYEERFDHLSMGTQEQIAVLVRLAFAEMLIDQGAPAAVILDDALVFSDDQRMRLMFDILSHAARHVQILVFTCRAQLFEGLGAHQLQVVAADPESLRSA